jgi:uncharacterized protein YgiM (DUF1202 family)
MEISNPIALQYVSNQGLASQLNTQNKQLPVKSDRFSIENKIPAPTEDEQRLRSEADKKKQLSANINGNDSSNQIDKEQENNSANSQNQFLNNNLTNFPIAPATSGSLVSGNLPERQNIPQQELSEQDITELVKEKEQLSGPIKSYLETSALGSETSNLARIDYFI